MVGYADLDFASCLNDLEGWNLIQGIFSCWQAVSYHASSTMLNAAKICGFEIPCHTFCIAWMQFQNNFQSQPFI